MAATTSFASRKTCNRLVVIDKMKNKPRLFYGSFAPAIRYFWEKALFSSSSAFRPSPPSQTTNSLHPVPTPPFPYTYLRVWSRLFRRPPSPPSSPNAPLPSATHLFLPVQVLPGGRRAASLPPRHPLQPLIHPALYVAHKIEAQDYGLRYGFSRLLLYQYQSKSSRF